VVVHGEPGLDEVSPSGVTRVAELTPDGIREYEISPDRLGLATSGLEGIGGGDPAENARIIEAVLDGASGAPRNAVLLNAAAALLVGGVAATWEDGVRAAESSIDEGRAAAALERLRAATQAREVARSSTSG
jgi:anthranilate phosphoribosyltransferase